MPGQAGTPDLDRFFDGTLSRLSGGKVEDAWWQKILSHVGHAYVAPDVIQREDLQSWLKDDQVRADFKALAGALMVEAPEAPEIRARLRERYAGLTQEAEYLADEPIEVVLAILLAAFVVDLGAAGERLAWLTLESDRETRADIKSGFEDVTRRLDNLGPDRLVEEVHSQRVSEELTHIQQRSAWDATQASKQVRQLLERVRNGDLRHANRATQKAVLYWAARLFAGQAEHLEEAKDFRDRLQQVDPAADTRIVDALILETGGDGNGALRMLRDIDEPDIRAVLFLILKRVRGLAAALGWFDEQKRRQDYGFLTGPGWCGVAVALAKAGRWEEAAAYLAEAQALQEDCLDLLFVEGAVNAALLLPSELRRHALDMNLLHPGVSTAEGPEADRNRERATLCFRQAQERMTVHFPERASGAQLWLLWLRLTHPDSLVSQAAREEVREQMQEPEEALSLLPVARAFGIPFEVARLRSWLDQRERLGGLEEHELKAEFMLAEMSLEPTDLLAFLDEKEPRLSCVLPAGVLSMARIEALAKDSQAAKARDLLSENSEEFEANDRQRLVAMIDEHEGKDPLPQLKDLYEASNELFDLQNLVQRLHRVRDWPALRPYLKELFRRERTLQNALRLVACMQHDPGSFSEDDILAFLEDNHDFAERNLELLSVKAWALFRGGRLDEARILNERLRSERSNPSDLQLEINLALQSGAWESFANIVEREWPKREEHTPEELIRLASLAAEANTTASRAFDLLRLAAEKGRDNPHVLTGAIGLAYRLGREGEELGDWLARAAVISSDEGPIKAFDLRTLVEEWMPAHRERVRTIEEHFFHGSIPLHVAAEKLNVPLSLLLIGLPRSNAPLQDGRRRTVIPIISGTRQPVPIRPEWTVGLDISTLMILTHLGLLQKTVESFRQVVLAPATMLLLLNERNRVRFHQPSLVKRAEEILSLIGTGQLRPEDSLPAPPQWLAEEVGAELAQLLQAARENQGCVVRPRPIHKTGSLMDKEARIGDFEYLVLSTVDFERILYGKGILDTPTHEKAAHFLQMQDLGTSEAAGVLLPDGPVYLDDLALSYLQSAGLLGFLASSGLDLRIHPSTRQDQINLIERSHQGEQLEKAIEALRVTLRDALHAGRVQFLPRHDPEAEEEWLSEAAPTLDQFHQDLGLCDAVCIDDRFVTKGSLFADRRGKVVPAPCVLDVLRHLEARGVLSDQERQAALHRLRQSGFVFVPVEPAELMRLLTSAPTKPDGTFGENAELRIIRQTLARIRSLDMLRQPGERAFLGLLRQAGSWVINQLWSDEGLPIERVFHLTDWVWHHVMSSPLDWENDGGNEAFSLYLFLLFQPLPLLREERQEELLSWLEERVLSPLASANAKLLDRLAELMGQQIEHWSKNFADD